MKRWLYRYRTATGVASVVARRLASDLRALLLEGTGTPAGGPAADGSFLVDLPAQVLGAEVTKAVRVRTVVATTHGARLVIPITWQAAPGRRAFPSFEGTLEIDERRGSSSSTSAASRASSPATTSCGRCSAGTRRSRKRCRPSCTNSERPTCAQRSSGGPSPCTGRRPGSAASAPWSPGIDAIDGWSRCAPARTRLLEAYTAWAPRAQIEVTGTLPVASVPGVVG